VLLSFRVLQRDLMRNKCELHHQTVEVFFFRNSCQNISLYDIIKASFKLVNFKPPYNSSKFTQLTTTIEEKHQIYLHALLIYTKHINFLSTNVLAIKYNQYSLRTDYN
jgi:16S rRNA G966 N2-methylase RsmD